MPLKASSIRRGALFLHKDTLQLLVHRYELWSRDIVREGYDPVNEWALIASGGSSTLDTEGRNSGRLFTTYMEPSMPSQKTSK
jgi:hypothetical protein